MSRDNESCRIVKLTIKNVTIDNKSCHFVVVYICGCLYMSKMCCCLLAMDMLLDFVKLTRSHVTIDIQSCHIKNLTKSEVTLLNRPKVMSHC